VNKVQLDIRTGHQQTIDKVINWVSSEDNSKKVLCDAGCGVGSLALPLSSNFKKVCASDISKSMTEEAASRAKQAGIKNAEFKVSDMEALTGKFDTVTCIDVMIHYPTDKVAIMIDVDKWHLHSYICCVYRCTASFRNLEILPLIDSLFPSLLRISSMTSLRRLESYFLGSRRLREPTFIRRLML
jgi:magnesium protoporphyrin O-methyltransferase